MAFAYWVRFTLLEGESPVATITHHVMWALLISPVYVFVYGIVGAYDYRSSSVDLTRLLGRAIAGTTIATSIFIVIIFVFHMVDMSRWLMVWFWAATTVLTCLKTVFMRRYLRRLHEQGADKRRVVLIGCGDIAKLYYASVAAEPSSPFSVLGSIGPRAVSDDLLHLGGYSRIRKVLDNLTPDEIVVALESFEQTRLEDILLSCESSGCKVSILPMYYQYLSNRPHISIEGSIPLINVNHVVLDNIGYAFAKRAIDVFGSIALIVLTSPVMLLAAIGTKLSSPGPVIFKQQRVGRGRRLFGMYKFRSMRVNEEADVAWTTPDDPRRTPFGAFMRRYSIDELPQLFNVLKGDMSLVGPRPEIPTYVDRFKVSVPLYMVRHQVRPGMTGWAQVNGLRGDTSIEERVKYDLYYINNWSLLFDLRILLMTPARGVLNNEQEKLVLG